MPFFKFIEKIKKKNFGRVSGFLRGYNIDSVTVTMGGVNVTDSVYTYSIETGAGTISIPNVTGTVVITATED